MPFVKGNELLTARPGQIGLLGTSASKSQPVPERDSLQRHCEDIGEARVELSAIGQGPQVNRN
jgi:hypothetical protein